MITFEVKGRPATAGSKRPIIAGNGRLRTIDSSGERGKSWRSSLVDKALEFHSGALLDGPLRLTLEFTFSRPKKHFFTGKRSTVLRDDAPSLHTSKPDVTKLTRAVEDALTKVLWIDDAQIAETVQSKRYGVTEGVVVKVERL